MSSTPLERVARTIEAKTPEYALDEDGLTTPYPNGYGNGHGNGNGAAHSESIPLLAPMPRLAGAGATPAISRTASAQSTSSSRGILRRIFIDRIGTPSQHLLRPTFPPPSLSTYTPVPVTPMTYWEHVKLIIRQTISFGISTFFLAGVVVWAFGAEALAILPNWLNPPKVKKYAWDDDAHWRKADAKVSKEPQYYARQIGMDIENQTLETEDGFYLRYNGAGNKLTLSECTVSLTRMQDHTRTAEAASQCWCCTGCSSRRARL